jgi:hypothetical protein
VTQTAALARTEPADPPVQSFAEIQSIARLFMESRLFPDIKSVAVAVVKIMAGRELGFGPFASMSGIHVVQGKAEPGANLIATLVKRSGKYDYRVKKITNDVCEIEFFEAGEVCGVSTFTIEDAKRAGTQNVTKFPRNMLFARAMSNGVKWFCPDVESGVAVYAAGEIEDVPALPSGAAENATTVVSDPAPLDLIHKLHTLWLRRHGWRRVLEWYEGQGQFDFGIPADFKQPQTDDDLTAIQSWLTADAGKFLSDAWEATAKANAERAKAGTGPRLHPGDENGDPEPALAGDAAE